MASSKFHDEPFDADTITKLEIFETYLEEWLPVFIQSRPRHGIHIFDFFAGPGTDSEGTHGSPLRTVAKLENFSRQHGWGSTDIHLYFFDKKKKNVATLEQHLEESPPPTGVKVRVERLPFVESFPESMPLLEDPKAAKLLFIDQFGVSALTDEIFRQLTYFPKTDFLCFVSSHTLHRFAEHEVIQQKIIRPDDSYDIHRAVFEYYEHLNGINPEVYLAPFTIKKGSNIYGLIFGSQHPLGMHKFLRIAWSKDKIAGSANFDIDKTDIREDAPFLDLEDFQPDKKRKFERELGEAIRRGIIPDERKLLIYCIRSGFTGSHATPILKKLKDEGVIELGFRVPQEKNLDKPRSIKLRQS